jgi:ribonuclease III family protein
VLFDDSNQIAVGEIRTLSLRLLANLGDAVCNLYERERAVVTSSSADKVHRRVKARVNAKAQAHFLSKLADALTEEEKEIVRRARNLKMTTYGKKEQATYRQSTAFEALVGFLYLSDSERLRQIFLLLESGVADSEGPANP